MGLLGLGVLLGLGSWYAIRYGKPPLLSGELWLVFLVWLLFPLVISGFGAEADPVSLLRFPLRYSTFVLLALAHGVFDPVAAACLYWLAAMLLGISRRVVKGSELGDPGFRGARTAQPAAQQGYLRLAKPLDGTTPHARNTGRGGHPPGDQRPVHKSAR